MVGQWGPWASYVLENDMRASVAKDEDEGWDPSLISSNPDAAVGPYSHSTTHPGLPAVDGPWGAPGRSEGLRS